MPNMSYCRFTNTVEDLRECRDAMDEDDLSTEEQRARERMLLLCAEIAANYADEIEDIQTARGRRVNRP